MLQWKEKALTTNPHQNPEPDRTSWAIGVWVSMQGGSLGELRWGIFQGSFFLSGCRGVLCNTCWENRTQPNMRTSIGLLPTFQINRVQLFVSPIECVHTLWACFVYMHFEDVRKWHVYRTHTYKHIVLHTHAETRSTHTWPPLTHLNLLFVWVYVGCVTRVTLSSSNNTHHNNITLLIHSPTTPQYNNPGGHKHTHTHTHNHNSVSVPGAFCHIHTIVSIMPLHSPQTEFNSISNLWKQSLVISGESGYYIIIKHALVSLKLISNQSSSIVLNYLKYQKANNFSVNTRKLPAETVN